MKHSYLLSALLVCFLTSGKGLIAQCTLACNNLVNVSLPAEGFTIVLPDMILDGAQTACPGSKAVTVFSPDGVPLGDTVSCTFAGEVLNVVVSHPASGNSCWGTILLEDKLPPVITCANLTVNCTADTSPDSIGFPALTDNCDADPTLVFTQFSTILPCSNPFSAKIFRTWHAHDEAGNVAAPCTQVISIIRPLLSQVVFPPDRDGVQAPALLCANPNTDPMATGFPTIYGKPVTEFCKMNVDYADLAFPGCAGQSSIVRSWSVLDCCSNQLLEDNQVIEVVDGVVPVLSCPDSLVFGANGPGCSGSFVLPPMSAQDNCSASLSWRVLRPGFSPLTGNGGPISALGLGVYPILYEATDDCGNAGTCPVLLVVADNVAPIAVCGENTSVSLNSQGSAQLAATLLNDGSHDNCCPLLSFSAKRMDQPNAPFAPSVQFDCGDVAAPVLVLLQVTDCHTNTNQCMVSVTVQDKTPPTLVCPPVLVLSCTSPRPLPLSLTGSPLASDACGLDTLFFNDLENLNPCHSGTIVRTFTAVDSAGFEKTCTQLLSLVDTSGPQFFFPPDTVVGCVAPLAELPVGQALAWGDCELFGLNRSDEIFPIPCGMKIYRTYSFIEWCSGVDTSHTQLIVVHDEQPPVWDIPQGSLDRLFLCEGDVVKPPPPTASDFCSSVTVDVISDVITPGDCLHHFNRVLTYGAQDTCGNVAAPFPIHIVVYDTLPPYAEALPDLGPFACYADRPAPDVAVVTGEADNCFGAVSVAFVSDSPDPGCSGTVTRTYRLTDLCGNDVLLTQNILLGAAFSDDTLVVSGWVLNEGDDPVSGVELRLFDNAGTLLSFTDATGGFLFEGLPSGMSCTLQPAKNGDFLNGVTTFDLVLLTRHILGSQLLDSPYKIIAADVNNSGSVTTFDMVALRKVILGIEDAFPNNNTSWRFVEADHAFDNPDNPLASPFPENSFLSNINADLTGHRFVAIKIGDLNGSANLMAGPDVPGNGQEANGLVPLVPDGPKGPRDQ